MGTQMSSSDLNTDSDFYPHAAPVWTGSPTYDSLWNGMSYQEGDRGFSSHPCHLDWANLGPLYDSSPDSVSVPSQLSESDSSWAEEQSSDTMEIPFSFIEPYESKSLDDCWTRCGSPISLTPPEVPLSQLWYNNIGAPPRTFSTLSDYSTVSEGKQYHCGECQKHFSNSEKLEQHAKTSKHRPYVCSEINCGKTYTRRDVLGRHVATHRRRNALECTQCGSHDNKRFFTRRDHLKQHMKKCHGDSKVKLENLPPSLAFASELGSSRSPRVRYQSQDMSYIADVFKRALGDREDLFHKIEQKFDLCDETTAQQFAIRLAER